MGTLSGKVGLTTGAGSGIGQAAAVAFAENGADVVVDDLHEDAGARSTAAQVDTVGRRAIPLQRAAQPRGFGRLAVYLASSDADHVTGSSDVIGGRLLQIQEQGA